MTKRTGWTILIVLVVIAIIVANGGYLNDAPLSSSTTTIRNAPAPLPRTGLPNV